MSPELDPNEVGDHVDRLYRAALALCGHREDAEDLVQETYLRVLSHPRDIAQHESVGYVLGAMRNVFLTRRRDAARRPQYVAMEFDPAETRPVGRPEDVITAIDLYAAISRLSGDHRDVITAVDVVGLSYQEAAELLQIPPGTVMSRLFRARTALAGGLDEAAQ